MGKDAPDSLEKSNTRDSVGDEEQRGSNESHETTLSILVLSSETMEGTSAVTVFQVQMH
jgi:hypothetical protein